MLKVTKKYDDIINMPRHVSKKHKQMSMYSRSAQFAPFSAVTGYEESIEETCREVEKRKDLSNELKILIGEKIKYIADNIKEKPLVTFTYFAKDLKKDGGKYITVTKKVKKVDEYNQKIFLEDNFSLNFADIISINGDLFKI